jgi:hypothetical protein
MDAGGVEKGFEGVAAGPFTSDRLGGLVILVIEVSLEEPRNLFMLAMMEFGADRPK